MVFMILTTKEQSNEARQIFVSWFLVQFNFSSAIPKFFPPPRAGFPPRKLAGRSPASWHRLEWLHAVLACASDRPPFQHQCGCQASPIEYAPVKSVASP